MNTSVSRKNYVFYVFPLRNLQTEHKPNATHILLTPYQNKGFGARLYVAGDNLAVTP
jgi:hypothetical protein